MNLTECQFIDTYLVPAKALLSASTMLFQIDESMSYLFFLLPIFKKKRLFPLKPLEINFFGPLKTRYLLIGTLHKK